MNVMSHRRLKVKRRTGTLQVSFDGFGNLPTDTRHTHQVFDIRCTDGVDVIVKGFEQRFAARWTDARHAFQLADQPYLCPLIAVGGNGEAMGLVAHTLHKIERL